MADVRAALSALPVEHLSTLLASGNVVCTFAGTAAELRPAVEATLRSSFGYDAWVVVVSAERLAQLLDRCPFPSDSADTHTYVTVAADPAALDELITAVAEADPSAQEERLGPEASAWTAPVGGTLDSPRSKIAGRARYRVALTDRNLRTMIKVRAALEHMPAD